MDYSDYNGVKKSTTLMIVMLENWIKILTLGSRNKDKRKSRFFFYALILDDF
jgi:hypothetical protein